jgi:hypothetical protein
MRNSSSVEGGTTNDPILGVVRTPLTKIFPPEDASEYVVPDSVAAEPGLIVWVPMRNSVAVGAVCDGKLSLGRGRVGSMEDEVVSGACSEEDLDVPGPGVLPRKEELESTFEGVGEG